jgi:tetratricopeptide (TPR) repeat protein
MVKILLIISIVFVSGNILGQSKKLEKGKELMSQGLFEEANQALKKAEYKCKRSEKAEANHLIGDSYVGLKKYTQAETYYRRANLMKYYENTSFSYKETIENMANQAKLNNDTEDYYIIKIDNYKLIGEDSLQLLQLRKEYTDHMAAEYYKENPEHKPFWDLQVHVKKLDSLGGFIEGALVVVYEGLKVVDSLITNEKGFVLFGTRILQQNRVYVVHVTHESYYPGTFSFHTNKENSVRFVEEIFLQTAEEKKPLEKPAIPKKKSVRLIPVKQQ